MNESTNTLLQSAMDPIIINTPIYLKKVISSRDATNLFLDSKEVNLYFTNKNDYSLWGLKLKVQSEKTNLIFYIAIERRVPDKY